MLLSIIDRRTPMRPFGTSLALVLVAAAPMLAQQSAATRRLLSARELSSLLADPAIVVLHVAEDMADYTRAHIPGARFVRYASVASDGADDLGAELPPDATLKALFEGVGVSNSSRVVIYGHTVLASRVFFTLDVVGHANVAILDGGLKAWQAEGHPLDNGPEPSAGRARGAFTPRVNPERLATADWIRANAGKMALVDVRPDPEFTGSDGGMGGMHAVGHIDGAKQLPWNTLVDESGRFLPEDQLRAKLAAAGAVAGKPVVPYCMIGMRASVVYFVSRYLGLDARLYDGSIVDWGRRQLPTRTGR
jgi:thiosulfate/3-mercaptopyruvate sulfurtransferase